MDAGDRLAEASDSGLINILDTPGWTVQTVGLGARRIRAQKGLDLLVIDYLQLLSSGTNTANQVDEVSLVSRSVKELGGMAVQDFAPQGLVSTIELPLREIAAGPAD